MVNVGLLKETLRVVKREAKKSISGKDGKWDQFDWENRNDCGSSFCFAGWACVIAGYDIDQDRIGFVICDGESRHISDAAQSALGIRFNGRDDLFTATNNIEDLSRIVKDIIKEEENNDKNR